MRKLVLLVGLLSVLGPGCGDDENKSEDSETFEDGLSMELSGQGLEPIAWERFCSSSGASESVALEFFPDFEGQKVGLTIRNVPDEGEASDLPSSVEFTDESDKSWSTDSCIVQIERNEPLPQGDDLLQSHRLVGNGTCTEPAEPSGAEAEGTVEIGEFNFRCDAAWMRMSDE